jgi:glycosyltransferase involved in cell wall biosynthesis
MLPNTLHQFLTGATKGDAITQHALTIRRWLREMGVQSEIYGEHIHDSVAAEIRPYLTYRPTRHEPYMIYHHSLGSNVADWLLKQTPRLILIHHNVTPPEFFARVNPAWAQVTAQGQTQLHALQPKTEFAFADSAFNELELQAAGYTQTAVLPIVLDENEYNQPLNEALVGRLRQLGPKLLFVGRLSPNKRQEDLVKLLYYLRRIQPEAHLLLVGDRWEVKYDKWVEWLAADLGLGEAVTLTGKVSQQDMVTYYKTADLYISMSEHEGFGQPLIESMYLDLPILAYASTSIPYTLNKVGVQFHSKDYDRLAELVEILLTDQPLRQRLIGQQRHHVQNFLEPQVRRIFRQHLDTLFN